jgi:hypothetical protein
VPHLLYGDMHVVELSVLDTEMRYDIEENSSISISIYIHTHLNYKIVLFLSEGSRKSELWRCKESTNLLQLFVGRRLMHE